MENIAAYIGPILFIIAGAVGHGFLQRVGELVAEGGLARARAETVGRDEQKGNDQALKILRAEKDKHLEDKEKEIEEKEKRIEKKEERISEIEGRLSDFERITRSLKNESVARQRLINRYWKPLHAVIICFANQKDADGETLHFVKKQLEENHTIHHLAGTTYIIPPASIPEKLKEKQYSRENLKEWIEEDIYSDYPGAKSTISFAGVFDLRNVYSRSDHDPDDRVSLFSTIDEELQLEEIFSDEDFSKLLASSGVNLTKTIEQGDVAFFASKSVSTEELDKIHENQEKIENQLGNPNLKELAEKDQSSISQALKPYVSDSESVAESVIEQANIWTRELYE